MADIRSFNMYDCLILDQEHEFDHSQRVFGNAHVGNAQQTNLQVAGQLTYGSDSFAFIQNWYARTNVAYTDSDPDRYRQIYFDEWAHSAQARLIIGEKYTWGLSVSDLLLRRRWATEGHDEAVDTPRRAPAAMLWPLVVPPRQWLSVMIDSYGGTRDRLLQSTRRDDISEGWRILPHPMVWIHLEGIIVSELGIKAGAIVNRITQQERDAVDIADVIADWMMGLADKSKDDSAQAQLHALADGVRERRWMGTAPAPPVPVAPPAEVGGVFEDEFTPTRTDLAAIERYRRRLRGHSAEDD